MTKAKAARRMRGVAGLIKGEATVIGGVTCTREIFPEPDLRLDKMVADAAAPEPGQRPVGQCVVCYENVYADHGSACGCIACESCMRKWIDQQLDRCVVEKSVRVTCVGCRKMLPQKIALAVSPAAAALADKIDRRFRLESNVLYPLAMQVECPKVECVGIGYIGFETIMCFLCEHQWSAAGDDPESADIEAGTLGAVKECPKCRVKIEKNGGCDHMTCTQCSYQFYWTTLKAYS